MPNDNLSKIEKFFEYDLKVKTLMNKIMPSFMDFYDITSRVEYLDKIIKGIKDIGSYLSKMMYLYNIDENIIIEFNQIIKEMEKFINSEKFYYLLEEGYKATLNFFNTNISGMRSEFVASVKKGFLGYYMYYGFGVIEPITINEYLHYIHSYVVNREYFYDEVPLVKSYSWNNALTWEGYYLRGLENEFGLKLLQGLIASDLSSSRIDILNLKNKIIMMARDLGHAAVLEIDLEDMDNIFVKYFIPKNCNKKMMAKLKGINENTNNFATGSFMTSEDKIVSEICTLMQGIPTDRDMELNSFKTL